MNIMIKTKIIFLVAMAMFFTGCQQEQKQEIISQNILKQQVDCYPVYEGIPNLNQKAKEQLIETGYLAIDDVKNRSVKIKFDENFNAVGNEVAVTLRADGKQLGQGFAQTGNLEQSVYQATKDAWAKKEKDNPEKINIEVTILGPEKEDKELANFEPGIHSVRIKSKEKSAIMLSKEVLEKNYIKNYISDSDRMGLVNRMCKKIGECITGEKEEFYIMESVEFANTHLTGDRVVTFYRGNELNCDFKVTTEEVKKSLKMAENWFKNSLAPRGDFRYSYYPSLDEYSPNNNFIRQFLASRYLAEMAQEDKEPKELHKKNLDYIFNNWYQEDGEIGYVYNNKKPNGSKLGANALLIRVLIFSPFFEEYQDKANKLANGILSTQKKDGNFKAFYIEPNKEYDEEYYLNFYSGEAILALVELYQETGNKKYLESAIRAQDYYLVEYVDELEENYYPAYVPWHSQSLFKIYQKTDERKYLKAILTMNDKLLELQNADGRPYLDYKGRFFNPQTTQYGWPHSASDGPYTESLAYAYKSAKILRDQQHQKVYKKRLLISLANLVRLQYNEASMYYITDKNTKKARGGLRTNLNDNRLRLDTTGHAVDALSISVDLLNDM